MRYTMENQRECITASVDESGEKTPPEQRKSGGDSSTAATASVDKQHYRRMPTDSAGRGPEEVEASGDETSDGRTFKILDDADPNVTKAKVDTDDDKRTPVNSDGGRPSTLETSADTHDDSRIPTGLYGAQPDTVSVTTNSNEPISKTENEMKLLDETVATTKVYESTPTKLKISLNKLDDGNVTRETESAEQDVMHTPTDWDNPSPVVLKTSIDIPVHRKPPTNPDGTDTRTVDTSVSEAEKRSELINEHEWQGARPKTTRREREVNRKGDKQIKSKHETRKVAVESDLAIAEPAASVHVSIPPGSICIITMNVKTSASVEKRRQAIQHVLTTDNPKLVLFQEYLLDRIHKWKDFPVQKYYEYTGSDKASLLYDSRDTRITDACHTSKLQEIVKELKRTANNRLRVTFPKDFNPIPRICMKKVETKGAEWVKFICVSWHGRPNKKSKLELQADFNYFLEFLRIVHERYKLPLCVGGDFNIDVSVIESLVTAPFVLHTYTATGARHKRKKGILDYFICTSELQLTHTRALALPNDGEDLEGVVEPVVTYLCTQP